MFKSNKRGRGRPEKGASSKHICGVRLDDYELDMLEFVAKKNSISKSDVLRRALRAEYNLATLNYDEL